MGVPRLPDVQTILALGLKQGEVMPDDNLKIILRTNDEQIHCNRFQWQNLPKGITGNDIERMLYYRGQIAWFVLPNGEYTVLPFCLNGGIDLWGRYQSISPLPFNGSADIKTIADAKKSKDQMVSVLTAQKANVLYRETEFEDLLADPSILRNSAVILSDYTRQLPQTIIPKYRLTEPIIEYESKMIPYLSTALSNATGIQGVRVDGQEEQATVEEASRQMNYAALTGKKWIPMLSKMEFQELTSGQVAKAEEFLLTMQALDNYRLGIHGVENGGLFEKKAHTTDLENSINMGTSGFAIKDALYQRQNWCAIINSTWGLNLWCMPDEITVGMDYDMNGMVGGGMDTNTEPSANSTSEEVAE